MVRACLHILSLIAIPFLLNAYADDGAIEINQVCATGGGCSQDDAPGFPVTIASSQKHVLTSSLEVPSATTAIEVSSDSATLDLNGYEVAGPVTCSGRPVTSCSSSSSEPLIDARLADNVSIVNGSVRGAEGHGVIAGHRSVIRKIRVEQASGNGVEVDNGSTLDQVRSLRNGANGLVAGSEGLVTKVVVAGNSGGGMRVGNNVVVDRASVSWNGDVGIYALEGSNIANVTVLHNGSVGILLVDQGFSASDGSSVVLDSTISSNSGFGIECPLSSTAATGLGRLVLNRNNDSGALQWNGNCMEIGTNICEGDLTCP